MLSRRAFSVSVASAVESVPGRLESLQPAKTIDEKRIENHVFHLVSNLLKPCRYIEGRGGEAGGTAITIPSGPSHDLISLTLIRPVDWASMPGWIGS